MSDFRDKYWFKDIRDITTIKELLYGSVETYPERPAFWVKRKRARHTSLSATPCSSTMYRRLARRYAPWALPASV